MKFTIERAPFIKALSHISAIVERRNTMPILANIKIEASETITITATDLDMFATEQVSQVNVDSPGAITVGAQIIFDVVKKLPDGANVSIEVKDGKLIVKAGRSRFSLPTIPVDDFPTMPTDDIVTSFTIGGDVLARAIDATKFAMSNEETRYYLNGLFWHAKDGGLTVAATDGHRLATHSIPIDVSAMHDIIVPKKCVDQLGKLLDGGDVAIDVSQGKIKFSIGNVVILSKLIDGTFPDYTRVIPKNNEKLLTIDPRAFKLAIERVATVASDKTKGVKVTINNDILTVAVVSPDNGSASEEVPCSFNHGDEFIIGFNSTYLREVLGQFDGDSVEFLLDQPNGPALIGGDYVLMPMRV